MSPSPSSPFVCVPATPDDIDRWTAMTLAFYASDPDFHGASPEETRRRIDELLHRPPNTVHPFLLSDDGTVAGYALLVSGYSVEWGGRVVWLDELFVDDAHRGRGVGAQALAWIQAWARAEGFRRLLLEVVDGSPAARLYARHGFTPLPRRIMTRSLDG